MTESIKGEPETAERENVKVVIRVRPPLIKRDLDDSSTVTIDSDRKVITLNREGGRCSPKSFKFDRVFGPETGQLELYKYAALPIVDKVVRGYNGTVFAYGQTGTGKTYTMMGDGGEEEDDEEDGGENAGIVPNAFAHIFSLIARYDQEKSFVVTATYLEIYNEDVRDLLSYNRDVKLEVRERSDIGVYVKGLMGFTIESIESLNELLRLGNKNRATKSTLMNNASSRSHAIFTVVVESKDAGDNNRTTVGKLNLVDLAGSERLQKTRASGERLREATNINQSLSVLGSVISALVDGKSTHVPYRNSKLTRLLQDSLGGNSKTTMVATISASPSDFDESICTLRYANRVKHIKNRLRVNVETRRGLIESFEEEIAKLQRKMSLISLRERKSASRSEARKSKDDAAYDEELETVAKEKEELGEKIAKIQRKILVGGENLLEKAQRQMFLLEMSDMELENLDKSRQELEELIQMREIEKIDFAERYTDLREESEDLTVKIAIVREFLDRSKREYAEKNGEYQNEIQILNENRRALEKETQLTEVIVRNYVPKMYRKTVEGNVVWNPEIDDFYVKGLQYVGNNQKDVLNGAKVVTNRDIGRVYGTYARRKE